MTGRRCSSPIRSRGAGLPLAGHKDNHAGLMTPAQIEALRAALGVRPGHEFDPWEGEADAAGLERAAKGAPFFAGGPRRLSAARVEVPAALPVAESRGKPVSTQMAFGQILNEIAREGGALADRIVTTAPDVTVSTNLGGWVNRRGLTPRGAGRHLQGRADPLDFRLGVSPPGQHLELGIAEANLMTMLVRARAFAPGERGAAAAGRHVSTTPSWLRGGGLSSTMPATRMRASSWSGRRPG